MISKNLSNLFSDVQSYMDPKKIAISILVLYGAKVFSSYIHKIYRQKKLQKIATELRNKRDNQIAKEFTGYDELSIEKRDFILGLSVTQLIENLNEGNITSVEILKTYHSRAITYGLKNETIAHSLYPEALECAKECDKIRAKTPKDERKNLGPLFGIPISIKDSFEQKGIDSTCGSAQNIGRYAEKDGEIIQILKQAGAIPYIRSNIPQTLLGMQSINAIWGRARNPWNKGRTPGGSSGGEGALVASRCSPIGLGSDGVGSLRVPACFNGVYSIRPTRGRTCTKGHTQAGIYAEGKFTVLQESFGPIGRNVDDLILFYKAMLTKDIKKYDPFIPYQPWNNEEFVSKKSLKIGYFTHDDYPGACASVRRAVEEAKQVLKKQGHEVVEVKLPNLEKMSLQIFQTLLADGRARGTLSQLKGEKPVKEIEINLTAQHLPNYLIKVASAALKIMGEKRFSKVVASLRDTKTYEFLQASSELLNERHVFLEWWAKNKFDAIIAPQMGLPAFPHGVDDTFAVTYMFPPSLCNLPAGIVPVTKVKKEETSPSQDYSKHSDSFTKNAMKGLEGSQGMPIAVQVWALPFEDEKCFRVMKELEESFDFHELVTDN